MTKIALCPLTVVRAPHKCDLNKVANDLDFNSHFIVWILGHSISWSRWYGWKAIQLIMSLLRYHMTSSWLSLVYTNPRIGCYSAWYDASCTTPIFRRTVAIPYFYIAWDSTQICHVSRKQNLASHNLFNHSVQIMNMNDILPKLLHVLHVYTF